jgi:hypothetical protein
MSTINELTVGDTIAVALKETAKLGERFAFTRIAFYDADSVAIAEMINGTWTITECNARNKNG